ncbi:MAG: glucose-1-phosphate adenylyltransferase [Fibrobacteres bacterium]|nr:glucose-1-phosphate adenylyltransferase [Fibrobacterota bacterium]
MIMAGGQGSRLWPLTADRAKPAVHFGGKYRIIDFVLNNFVNSGIHKIKLLTQFKSDSLNRHVQTAWSLNRTLDQYVDLVPAQMRTGTEWYRGTADAIYQNVNCITDERPDLVAVFGGDHIYKMDLTQMIDFHMVKGALCTVSAFPVPVEEASEFGVIEVDEDGRMVGFEEKPSHPKPMPGRPGWALCSMGNYLFHSKFLVRELLSDAQKSSAHDFGKDIIPNIYHTYPVYVYDFTTNRIPGETAAYWRDVGTLQALFEANLDLVKVSPEFNLYNPKWALRSINWNAPPAKFVFNEEEGEPPRRGFAHDSIVCDGCIVSGGGVTRSILAPHCFVHSFAQVEESILFPDVEVGRHAMVRRAIVEKGVRIPPGAKIGFDLEKDAERFHVSEEGIVVISKGTIIQPEL